VGVVGWDEGPWPLRSKMSFGFQHLVRHSSHRGVTGLRGLASCLYLGMFEGIRSIDSFEQQTVLRSGCFPWRFCGQ
jgi:hypothetical protein